MAVSSRTEGVRGGILSSRDDGIDVTDCGYCGCAVDRHDPVFVAERVPDAEQVGFCNSACLQAHVDDEGSTTGTACVWDPGSTG